MKRLIFLLALFASGGWSAAVRAQNPRLNEMTFRIDGRTVTCTTGEVRVAVTMVFNTAMRDSIPVITFGLDSPYPTPLPLITKTWVNSTTFVASFDINNRVPPTADGLYKFLIRQAYAAGGDTLTPVLSDAVKNGSTQPSTLYISRTGKLTATTSKVDFGVIKAGASFDKTLVIRNATCAEVFLTRFTLSDPFAVVNPPVGVKVSPDSNLTLKLRFSSFVRKAYAGVIKINYTSNSLQDSLLIQLTGVTRGPEMVFIPAPALNFGTLVLGDSAAKSFRVTNRKAADETLADTLKIFSTALNPIAGYILTPLPAMMAPGDTKSVTVKFKPAEGRIYNSSLDFTTNDLIKPLGKISFPVSGAGQILTPPPRVDTLLVDWPGGRAGYTNVDSLTIYLNLTVASVAEVQEARWKFNFLPSAPTTPNDTAGTARIFIVNNRPCFKIPLRNVLSAGRWNCYVWLQGRNGVSGYLTPNYAPLYYDITAPAFTTLPGVTAGWSGPVGYTNADNLTLCWEASDSSDITEVRWKFLAATKPATEPAQIDKSAITSQDGKFYLTIPLKDKIVANQRWYLYLWLVDGSGNSGYANASGIYFKYDRQAPGKARHIDAASWFGRPNERTLFVELDLATEATDAAKVFWKFWNVAISDSSFLKSRNVTKVRFPIVFDSRLTCGYDSLKFWFADSAGNVNPDNFATLRYRFDSCAPKIKRTSRTEAIALKQTAFVDNIAITDHSWIDTNSVVIFYRFGGTRDKDLFLARAARQINRVKTAAGDSLSIRLQFPPQALTTSGLGYRLLAADTLNNSSGEGEWIPIRVRVANESRMNEGKPVAQSNGSDSNAYRLIAMPLWLDKPKAKDVLEDDLGSYNRRKWRLVEYRPDLAVPGKNPYVDYDRQDVTIADFAPGRAFFLIVRDSNKVIDSGGGVTVSTVKDFTLILQEGWNLIGNPFNFPISVEMLEISNSRLNRQFFSLEGTYTPHFDAIEPWKGYAVKVVRNLPGDITLRIPPISAKPGLGKARAWASPVAGEWTLQIAARVGATLDTINWVGARQAAADEYDDFDLVEPPAIGSYVSVYFANTNWSDLAMNYTADFRPMGHDLYEWPVNVASNYPNREVVLEFKDATNLPAEYEAYLIDAAYGMARNLKSNPSYRIVTTANGIEKSLKLLVGKPEALQKRAGGLALVPSAFELAQNFPNPFATQQAQALTAIRYALPKPATVTVEVYNMLGQKVRTLVNRQLQAADYYMATWNGRDEAGKEVSSGVYVYRLLAESGAEKFAATKKLLLVK